MSPEFHQNSRITCPRNYAVLEEMMEHRNRYYVPGINFGAGRRSFAKSETKAT